MFVELKNGVPPRKTDKPPAEEPGKKSAQPGCGSEPGTEASGSTADQNNAAESSAKRRTPDLDLDPPITSSPSQATAGHHRLLTTMASVSKDQSGDQSKKKKPSALRSIIAGSTAGALEIAITYPAEFAKTRSQLNRRLPEGKKLPWPPFGSQWYAGCTTLIIGNSAKAGIRFVAFDQYKSMLADADGKLTGPRTVLAGFGAGVTESLLAVTPTESIKTTLIDDRKAAKPRLRGFLHAVPIIARERGLRGFFQGFVPTTARQAANSAVRFGSYGFLKQMAESYTAPGEKLGSVGTFAIGAMAGLVTVAVTQPLDTVKTRMQSIEARSVYGSTLRCAAIIFKNEGVLTFWSGALPRLARLVMSGGIVFTMYEKSMELMDRLDPEMKMI
ncbi:Mitochondrial carrier domain protein [Paramyrothecium foliicola]|nr:Mitochondrial carrier domain protein [Paramyrothecium foliicola]